MKKKLLSLLALVMTVMTASAIDIPTYDLKVGTNAQGTVKFYVGEAEVTKAAEGATAARGPQPMTSSQEEVRLLGALATPCARHPSSWSLQGAGPKRPRKAPPSRMAWPRRAAASWQVTSSHYGARQVVASLPAA
jgi:hypothetical protein